MVGRICVACMVAAGAGCAGLNLPFRRQPDIVEATARNPAREITCIWQPAEGVGPKGVPTRGMAGQILFFTPKSDAPAKVDGEVLVYLFDDQGTPEEQAKPIHKYRFEAPAWNTHLLMSNLGPSYQVFIPYSRPGHHQAKCSLRMRFKSSDGRTIYSEPVVVTLPGTIEKEKPTPLGADPDPVSVADRKLRVDTAGRIVNRQMTPTPATRDETTGGGDRISVVTSSKPVSSMRRETTADPNIRRASGVEETSAAEKSRDDSAEQRLDRLEAVLYEFVEENRRARQTGASMQRPRTLPRRLMAEDREARDNAGAPSRRFERKRFERKRFERPRIQARRSSDGARDGLGQPRDSGSQQRGANWSEHPLGDLLEASDRTGSVRPDSATGRGAEKQPPGVR